MGANPSHDEISSDILREIEKPGRFTPEQQRIVRYALRKALAREAAACFMEVQNAEDKKVWRILLQRIEREHFIRNLRGEREASRTDTQSWAEWYPGLDTDDVVLRDLYRKMPGFPPEAVASMVRLFENPDSPVAFEGAITLERHDILHCLLGRGLVDQDEAFVLGFTMGTSPRINPVKTWAFKMVLAHYPEPYRILGPELQAYDLGVEAAQQSGVEAIYDQPLEQYYDQRIGDIRRTLGIDKALLMTFYAREQSEIPGTPASLRLPTHDVVAAR